MHIILGIMLGLLVPYLVRVIIGPSVWDRLLGMNLILSKTIIIIILFAAIHERTFLLDFAIIYALSGFIGTIFLALFLSQRNLQKGHKPPAPAIKTETPQDSNAAHSNETTIKESS